MSPAEPFVRHHKRRTDRAISAAFARLTDDAVARERFAELLHAVRQRAPRLLDAPTTGDRHPGVEALVTLARHANAHLRTVHSWVGSDRAWRPAVHALAQHLIARYPVPAFLAAAWYAADDAWGERARWWFIAHSRGAPFRTLDLPMRMTRRMEHVFLASPDHLRIEHAMRRAELIALGADASLVDAVLAARPAADLRHADFWRTAWHVLIANRRALDLAQVGPLIDFLHAARHEHVAVETAGGLVLRPPPLPTLALKGRTIPSLMRLMEAWHRGLGHGDGGYAWPASRLHPLVLEAPSTDPTAAPTLWELVELTNSAQLREEGAALQHCVASYGYSCWKGRTRLWSLRRRRGVARRAVVTVEVNPHNRTIVQARGFRNRRASGRVLEMLHAWASREGLRVASL